MREGLTCGDLATIHDSPICKIVSDEHEHHTGGPDEGEGYLKTLGNPEDQMFWPANGLAPFLPVGLGFARLQHAIIWVTPEDNIPLANGTLALPGPAFITRKIAGFPLGGDQTTLRTLREAEPTIARLVVFDTWIQNCDRHRPAPQPRLNRDNVLPTKIDGGMLDLLAMDHTHAFTCGSPLTKRIWKH